MPSIHGVTGFGIPLARKYPTWAELLKQNGYETAAFIGAVVLDSRTLIPGLDRGFDYYDNLRPPRPGKHRGQVKRRGDDVVHRAEAWMAAHPKSRALSGSTSTILMIPTNRLHLTRRFIGMIYDGEIAYADSALGKLLEYLKREKRYGNALIIVLGDHGEGLGEHGEQTHGIFLYD